MTKDFLKIKIISPKQVIFEGIVSSVSSINSLGKFDILSEHANFITLVKNSPIIIRTADNQIKSFIFPLAIIYTQDNLVKVYTDLQIPSIS